jgi:hypothetical protein
MIIIVLWICFALVYTYKIQTSTLQVIVTDIYDKQQNNLCYLKCNAYIQTCLKEFQRNVQIDDKCSFGKTESKNSIINIPIYHRWTETFTIILNVSYLNSTDTIVYVGNVSASTNFRYIHSNGLNNIISIKYRLRLICMNNHYTKDCSKTCYPRNDKFGHWICDSKGNKICHNGWTGTYCDDLNITRDGENIEDFNSVDISSDQSKFLIIFLFFTLIIQSIIIVSLYKQKPSMHNTCMDTVEMNNMRISNTTSLIKHVKKINNADNVEIPMKKINNVEIPMNIVEDIKSITT